MAYADFSLRDITQHLQIVGVLLHMLALVAEPPPLAVPSAATTAL